MQQTTPIKTDRLITQERKNPLPLKFRKTSSQSSDLTVKIEVRRLINRHKWWKSRTQSWQICSIKASGLREEEWKSRLRFIHCLPLMNHVRRDVVLLCVWGKDNKWWYERKKQESLRRSENRGESARIGNKRTIKWINLAMS